MSRLIDTLAEGVAEAALATCALARRVLNLTGVAPSKLAPGYPPDVTMVRHDVPPIE